MATAFFTVKSRVTAASRIQAVNQNELGSSKNLVRRGTFVGFFHEGFYLVALAIALTPTP
jgi:hypothetical protein